MTTQIGIIGGTGLKALDMFKELSSSSCTNEFGAPSAPLSNVDVDGVGVIFLARHGTPHTIPPHKVNYRANIYALMESGVKHIISVNIVGGITNNMAPGTIVLPDQIIDYTWSRSHTFFDDNLESVTHVDFTRPFCDNLRDKFKTSAEILNIDIIHSGTYGATQGPRLESAAEIRRMENDGCDIVGMTGMPEAGLARELNLNYVSICLVVNWAAGKTDKNITMSAIQSNIDSGIETVLNLIKSAIKTI